MDRLDQLARRLVKDLDEAPPGGHCIPPDVLEKSIAGTLEDDVRAGIETHLAGCLSCLNRFVALRDVLRGIAAPGPVSPRLAEKLNELLQGRRHPPFWIRVAQRVRQWMRWEIPIGWSVAAVAATAVLAWVIGFPSSREIKEPFRGVPLSALGRTLPGSSYSAFAQLCTTEGQGGPSIAAVSATGLAKLVVDTRDAVVAVTSVDKEGTLTKTGSGFFVDPNGLMLTSYHLIDGAASVCVKLYSGASFLVEKTAFVGSDPQKDIAIIKVRGRGLPSLRIGDSTKIQPGEDVVVFGNPLGWETSVSTGVISAVRRIDDRVLIQTTAPVSSGSSGGPLLSSQGYVIGVTTLSAPGGQNVNFALAINEAKALIAAAMQPKPEALATGKSTQFYFTGILYRNKNDYTNAQKYFHRAIDADPGNFDAWLELAGVYFETGRVDEEIRAYERAVALRPDSDEAHYWLATAYEEKGRIEDAAREYRRALALKPHPSTLFDLAILELTQRHCKDALDAYRQLKAVNPGMAISLQRILDVSVCRQALLEPQR